MEGKKKYFALVLFLFIGLMIFTFANPVEEEKEFKDGNNEQSEKVNNKKEDEDNNGQEQQNVQNDVTNTNTNNNNVQEQNKEDDSLAKAQAAVELAEGTYTQEDVDAAKELVNKVTDTTEKGKLEDRLAEVEAGIEVLALLEDLEDQVEEADKKEDMTNATSYRDDNEIQTKIEALKNEEVKEALQERLDTVSKLLDDNKAPIANVEAKAYNEDQTITAEDEAGNEFTMYLAKGTGKEKEIDNSTKTTGDGTYTLRLVDEAFNEQIITFVVDTTDPVFKGLKNGNHYDEVKIDVEDLTDVVIKVTNMDKSQTTEVENGTVLTEEATYKIVATDEAGNSTTYYVAIDKTAPTISGVTNNSYVNKSENAYIRDKFLTLVRVTAKYADGTEKVEEFTRTDFTVGPRNENFEYMYRATKEGTYTIYAEDKYGNNYQETFTIDRTAAKLVSANMYSTGDKYTEVINDKEHQVYYTTNGDTITAYIRVNEQLKAVPTIILTVGEKSYTATNVTEAFHKQEDKEAGIYRYQATVKVDEFNPVDGDVQVTVSNIKDKAGNETANVTKVTNRNIVRIDRTAATRVYSTIRSKATEVVHENGKDRDYYHKNGTEFEYAISFNELLANVPTVTIGGKEVTMKLNEKVLKNENKFLYEGTFKIAEDEKELPEGVLEIKVTNVKDLAGNETTLADQTKTSNGRRVIYDRTAAKRMSADFYVAGLTQVGKTFYTQYGKTLTVNVTTNEKLQTIPTFTLHNNGKDYVVEGAIYRGLNDKGYHLYQASYTITKESGMTDGEITFTVSDIKDIAGNVTKDVTEATNGRKVVLDNVLSIDKLAIIGKNGQWKDKEYIQYANTGTTIYVNARFKEELATTPVVKLNDKVELTKATKQKSGNIWIYSYSYKLKENDGLEDGTIQVKVTNIKDFAGNTAELTNANMTMESQSEVVVDRTLPTYRFTKAGSSLAVDEITPIVKDGVFYFNQPVRVTLSDSVNLRLHGINTYYDDKNPKRTGWLKDITEDGLYTAVAVDAAGNRLEFKFVVDTTAPEIDLPSKIGLNKNEMHVESGTEVTLEDVIAKVTDNIDGEYTIEPYKADLLISNVASENIYNYDFSNGFNTRYIGRYNIYYKTKDTVGNESTATLLLVMTDTTAPTIEIPGTAGLNKNEYHVESGTKVTLEDVLATVTDNVDETVKIKPYKADLLISNVASENIYNYDFSNGFNTRYIGRYNIYYTYTDKAGNTTNKTMLLVMTDTTAPTITIPGTAGLNKNEYIVEAGTHVTVDEIMATVTDNVDETVKIKPYKADLLISNVASENTYNYDFTNGFDTKYSSGRYNLYYEYTDKAGHKTTAGMMIVIKDRTAPTLRFTKAGSSLVVDEITPYLIDGVYYFNQDVRVTISDLINLRLHGVDTYYDDNNPTRTGWLTDVRTAGEHTVIGVDAAGNKTEFKFVLTKNTATEENNVITVTEDIFLIDTPFYNEIDEEEEVTINGNGKTVTQYVSSVDKLVWKGSHTTPNGKNVPVLGNVFSSLNGKLVTINNLTLTGTMHSVMFGNYEDTNSNWFNTKLNNVNIINTKVVSFSGGIAPAAIVYGNATLNNVNIYGTTRSELENAADDPYWPIYDLAAVNSTNTTINGGKIGSIYLWAKATMTINNAEIDLIDTLTTTGHLEIGNGTTVKRINMNGNNAYKPDVTIKSGATVEVLDLTKVTNLTDIIVEDGATVNTILTSNGEMTLAEWKLENSK